ncbi:DUF1491 family protein [Qipengyuania sp. DSG2-2]|uniref:DUF1491 family protein n=1 Tax=Qipengyuania sp. DGS2-2 TaxID=3349631 RepID=UPI0036D32EE8
MSDSRLPAHLEIGAIRRLIEAQGGFASVLFKGERDAGTIMLLTIENGTSAQLYERMPQMDGSRQWTLSLPKGIETYREFSEYCRKRHASDPDLWILEADIADPARFIESLSALS